MACLEDPISAYEGGVARPRVWPVFGAFGICLTGLLAVGALMAMGLAIAFAIQGLLGHAPNAASDTLRQIQEIMRSPYSIGATAALGEAMQASLALLLAALSPVEWRARLRLGGSRISLGSTALACAGFFAFSEMSDAILPLMGLHETGSLGRMVQAYRQAPWPAVILGVLSVGLGAGIAEELLFRGYIQTRLSQRWGPRVGVLVAAALFGVIHLDWVHAPLAFAMGLALGWLAERTGSIFPGMVAHAFNNAAWLLTVRLLPAPSRGAAFALLGASAVVALACAVSLDRVLPPRGRGAAQVES